MRSLIERASGVCYTQIVMKYAAYGLCLVCVSILLFGCAGVESAESTDFDLMKIDEAVRAATLHILEIVPDEKSSIAVYYFTTGEKKSDLSDYITNGLTTELANRAGPETSIVSRQAIDRIMSEFSYQLSDLVDRDQQVSVGRQLGANLILTGFITPLGATTGRAGKLNAQLIEIETARVLGGFVLDFRVPSEFSIPDAIASRESEVQSGQPGYPRFSGVATVTTVFDNFDSGIADMQLGHEEEHWGDRVIDATSSVSIESEAENSFALFTFRAEFDHVDLLSDWRDSDVGFYARIDTKQPRADFDGVSIRIRSENAGIYSLNLNQRSDGETVRYRQSIHINEAEWREIKIPFDSFVPLQDSEGPDSDIPLQIEIYLPFLENHQRYYLREGTNVEARLAVDDIGLYRNKSEDRPEDSSGLIEAFEDEIDRAPFTYELYGADYYMDYRQSDSGTLVRNPGVESQTVSLSTQPDGPAGDYFAVIDELSVNGNFPGDFPLSPFLRSYASVDAEGTTGISFLFRSNIGTDGYFELQDIINDRYYGTSFRTMNSWSRIQIPFTEMGLENPAELSDHVRLVISYETTPEMLAGHVVNDIVTIESAIDEIRLYEE